MTLPLSITAIETAGNYEFFYSILNNVSIGMTGFGNRTDAQGQSNKQVM